MKPDFLVSKKGTVVITASQLWDLLGGSENRFQSAVTKWLDDVYEFDEVVRKPLRNTDYGLRKITGEQGGLEEDYYLTISFAKQIVLRSNFRDKMDLAKRIKAKEVKSGIRKNFSFEEVAEIVHLSKAMKEESFQIKSEESHFLAYKNRNGDTSYWWKYRAELLGVTIGKIKKWLARRGQEIGGKSSREMIKSLDSYELIRIGVIDYLIAQGKHWYYARQAGELAKLFVKEMDKIEGTGIGGFTQMNRENQLLLWN